MFMCLLISSAKFPPLPGPSEITDRRASQFSLPRRSIVCFWLGGDGLEPAIPRLWAHRGECDQRSTNTGESG